jgi:hypothetical protein
MRLILVTLMAISMLTSASAQVSEEVLDSISTLDFFDGAPSPETAQKTFDYLDTMRSVEVYYSGSWSHALSSNFSARSRSI